jgi:hypothetical protein
MEPPQLRAAYQLLKPQPPIAHCSAEVGMDELLVEGALLRQVIANRKTAFNTLPIHDKRRGRLADELTLLYAAQSRLGRMHWREIERIHGARTGHVE